MTAKNHSLLEFLSPVSKQSNSKLQKTREYVEDYQFLTNWHRIEHDGWILPATKEKHYWCGNWQTFGCLNKEAHQNLGKGNRIYIKQFQRSCYRASCEQCYLNWIARQANASTTRINQYGKSRKPVHLLLSVNSYQYYLTDKELRQRVRKILEIIGFEGGAIIFHPFRFNKKIRCWYYSPHFHVIGFVNRHQICRGYGKFGWYVKDLGWRDSVFQSFCYLLSHCGIKKGVHSVSWIGRLSYSKLKVEKEPKITKCPVCGGDFEEVYYEELFHPVVPPDKPYEGLVESDGWYPVETLVFEKDCRFDYAPTIDLNETLKGLAN